MMSFHDDPQWQRAWDPVIEHIGQPFSTRGEDDDAQTDPVERGAIRKYIEPLEIDCALHFDAAVARRYGYPDVVAPYTAIVSFALGPMWRPGTTLYTSDEPNAQPALSPVKPKLPHWFPPVTGYFATDMEFEFRRPATVGDVVRMRPGVLLSCDPKETSVGRGAFITSDSSLINQEGEQLARMISGSYLYQPHPEATR